MCIVRGMSAFLVGIAASLVIVVDGADGATYKGTIALPVPFARYLDQPITLTASRDRRAVRFPRLKVYVDCPRGYYSWWTYALPPTRARAGRFSVHRESSKVRDGRRWRASIDLRGAFSPDAVPGVVGTLRATIWVPRIDAGGARTCRSGSRHFDVAVTSGAPTTRGAIRQLRGGAGCLTVGGRGGCTPVRGSLGGRSLVVSPDGKHVYTAGSDGILAFSRDSGSGALTQLDGVSGCLTVTGTHSCGRAERMRAPHKVEISPGGTAMYVSWSDPLSSSLPRRTGLSVLHRDPSTGALSEVAGETGCLDTEGLEGCAQWGDIWGDGDIASEPTGRHLYVAAALNEDISARVGLLHVEPITGGVRPPDPVDCPDPGRSSPCAPTADAVAITIAPDGRHLYAPDQAFSRDLATGLLAPVAGRSGCYFVPDRSDPRADPSADTCMPLRSFSGLVEAITMSPDGGTVYMGDSSTAVGGFTRERRSGRLTPLRSLGGCARLGGGAGCSYARALEGAHALAVAPDGSTVYALATFSSSVVVLNRDRRTGALWQLAGRNGCVAAGKGLESDTATCAAGRRLGLPWTLTLSPDGRDLYVSYQRGIGVFSRRTR